MDAAPSSELLAFQEAVFGRYSLQRELGRGGMGVVFLAHEVRLDRPVALKLLPPEYAADATLRERFLREARTAAKLSHPHIVPIHAVDEVGDFVFFAMAYVEGQTLGQRIRERGPVAPHEAARIMREVAWALGYAHAQGVVHRDVKPDNVLLESGSGRALVTDFGIAQVAEGRERTVVREVLGTAEFMSPEQASGQPVDERSDIYSLGVVGHYMLSGRLPFEGETVAATLAKQITLAAPALATVAPEIPSHLGDAVDRCLRKDRTERFSDGEALAAALGRSLEARREVPPALRAFLNEQRDHLRGISGIALLVAYLFVIATLALFDGDSFAALLVLGGAMLMAAAPVSMLVRMTRQLLRSGHVHDEVLLALRSEVEARREELASQFTAAPTWYDRLTAALSYGGLAVATVATGAMFVVESFSGMVAAGIALALGGATSLISAPLAATSVKRRRRIPAARWLRFWESQPGRWIFKLAGLGLRGLPSPAGSYRPTEMAIGIAADRLFDELPKELRRSFRELPDVVAALESHAEATRARMRELDGMLSELEGERARGASGGAGALVAAKRDALSDDLHRARDAAERRLSDVVAALETIRLELLRMHAGVGSVESMTADLGSAKDLSDDLKRLVEAGSEVDELLGIPRGRRRGDTPTPQPA